MWRKPKLLYVLFLLIYFFTLWPIKSVHLGTSDEDNSSISSQEMDKMMENLFGDNKNKEPGEHGAGYDDEDENDSSSENIPYVDSLVESPIVRTPMGKIGGKIFDIHVRNHRIHNNHGLVAGYLGIPFAEPPVGDLRFRPPKQKGSWKGVLNATEFGPICYQPGEQRIWDIVQNRNSPPVMKKRKLRQYNMSEDCLTINIYVPLVGPAPGRLPSELPVFFFIHGGSYYMNAGRLYTGQNLANFQNLIVVTFNYRLGPLGFLSTGDSAATGNYGMLDQALALDWTYKYIRFFGGDEKKITLVGNSAGGASVLFQMMSKLSRGKFASVAVQSGCSGAPWAIQLNPRKHAEHLGTKLECPLSPSKKLVDCIRGFSPEIIMKKAKLEDGLSLAYATVIDGKYGGEFLSDLPEKLIEANEFEHVPILTGFTRDEVTIWFLGFGPSTPTKDLRSFIQLDVVSLLEHTNVTNANIAAMIHSVTVQYLYREGIGEHDTYGKTTAISDFISDVGLKAPCIKELNLLSRKNTKPTYLYEFNYFSVDDQKMNQQSVFQDWIGSYHESELQFIFGEPYLEFSNHLRTIDDKLMSNLMMKIWGDFVRFGSPTPNVNQPVVAVVPVVEEEDAIKKKETQRSGSSSSTNTISNEEESLELNFNWKNYTELNQDYAILGLKSHMDNKFLIERMLFWNFFFPIFRDYPLQAAGDDLSKTNCTDWEILSRSWIFWALVSICCSLIFLLTILLTFRLRKRVRRRRFPTNGCSAVDQQTQIQQQSPILPNNSNNTSDKLVIHKSICQPL